MSEISKKRRILLDEQEIPVAKHAKRVENTYTNAHISGLIEKTSELEAIVRSMDGTEIADRLKLLIEKVPLILVFGMQSAGKSTLLNHLLFEGKENFKTGQGLITVCPTEVRCGPNYPVQRSYIYENGAQIPFEYYSNAHEYVKSKVGNRMDNDYIIYVEFPSATTLHVVDLPGLSLEPDNSKYIMKLRDQYLHRKETVVLHVTKADVDESNDGCARYFTPQMDVIKVYTRVDRVIDDAHAKAVLLDKLGKSKCAVFSAVDEKCLDVLNVSSSTIKGTKAIYDYMWSFLNKKIPVIADVYRNNISDILALCNRYLNEIGHQMPNPYSILYEVRTSIEEKIKERFALHGDFKTEFDSKVTLFTPNILSEYIKCLPSDDVLVAEINASSHGRFLNAIDWDTSAKKYHSQMLEMALNNSVLPAIDAIIEIYERVILSSYEGIRCEQFADDAISDLRKHAIVGLKDISTVLKEVISERVRELVHPAPWNIDHQHSKASSVLVEIMRFIIDSKQQLAVIDDRVLAKQISSKFKHVIPSCESTSKSVITMKESVRETWTRDVETIYNIVFRTIMSTFKELMTKLIVSSHVLTTDDIVEKKETAQLRQNYLKIASICESINDILNN